MTTTDLLANLTLIFIGITFSGAYYTKIVLRYPKLTMDQVFILFTLVLTSIGWTVFGAYNILTAAALPIS